MQMKFISSFLTLFDEQNFSKASTKLYISQQGLSRQIKALEEELDVSLFERNKQGVTPTEIGRTLYPIFRRMHGDYEKALSLVNEDKKMNRKCISVAFAQGLSNSGSAEFIFDYQKLHPEINIEILESTQAACIQKLLDKEVDMAFLVNPLDMSLFNTLKLSEGFMYAAMHKTHPLVQGDAPIEFILLDGENIITGSPENALRGMFDHFCKLTNIHPHIIVSSNYSVNYVNAMTENIGIATVTCAMALRITNPDIRIRRLLTPEPGCVYCCTPHNVKLDKEVSALRNYVKRYFEQNPLQKLDNCR